ncbi:MAG: hypothetical protein P0S93_02960 [Candidatus Neptunochlamydia sp.]|nr:hypothetical protein [Candidatus Neptunochlamydia sp.]
MMNLDISDFPIPLVKSEIGKQKKDKKMATHKQVKANRLNAQHSTGPKTNKGKITVAQNALKHGIFSKQLVLEDESKEEFEKVKEEFYEQFRPEGFLEVLFWERALSAIWRLSRIGRIESLIVADSGNPPFKEGKISDAFGGYAGGQLALMSRYEITLEKILFKSLNELRFLQEMRNRIPNECIRAGIDFVSQIHKDFEA